MTSTESESAQPHQARQIAESFGSNAERYDRARPDYPEAMVDRIVAASPGPRFLDVGIGTGIAARQFQEKGCQLVGIDVDSRMAELARRRGLDVEVAAFETWDQAGRTFDAIVCGQAWHWIDPVAGASKAAQALHPGGRLSLFWNVYQPPSEVSKAFADVYCQVFPDAPFNPWAQPPMEAYTAVFSKAVNGIRETGAFDDEDRWLFDWERSYTRDEWLDVVPTTGGHNLLAPTQLDELLESLGTTIDAVGGSFTMGYTSVVVTAARSPV